jgi:Tfp pilus assembly protein PilV
MTNTTARPSGFSLLEVIIMASILAISALALAQSTLGAMHQTRLANEMRAASFAARQRMEEVLMNLAPLANANYPVMLNSNGVPVVLPGINGANALEVIVVSNETTDPATLGRDLDGNGPAGAQFSPLPMDLDGDGVVDGARPNIKSLVGVLVRWISFNGREQRYELWSVK